MNQSNQQPKAGYAVHNGKLVQYEIVPPESSVQPEPQGLLYQEQRQPLLVPEKTNRIRSRINRKKLLTSIGLSLTVVYGTSVVTHPLEGLRTPEEYSQTLSKIGKMATDRIGITKPSNANNNQQEQNNE